MTDLRNNKNITERGLRNNNPFNMQKTNIAWQGKVTGTDARFETFSSVEMGIRAGIIDVVGDMNKKGLDTVQKLITSFAPPIENDTVAYINFVSTVLGIDKNDSLLNPKTGKVDSITLYKLAAAIIAKENNKGTFKASTIVTPAIVSAGVKLAATSDAIKKYVTDNLPASSKALPLILLVIALSFFFTTLDATTINFL